MIHIAICDDEQSFVLDGSVPAEAIKNLLSMSYELTMKKCSKEKSD